jgi:sn-glycerol 3-phosphate transport system substrate-binding protein
MEMERNQNASRRPWIRKTAMWTVAASFGLTALLAGCGGGNTGSDENAAGGGGGANNGVIELKLWHAMGGVPGQALQHIVDDFNKSQSKIHVTAVYQGQYDDEFNKWKATQGQGGKDGPNIMQVYDIGTKFMIDSQDIVPMQDFIDQSHFDISQLEPNILGYYSVGGKLYSMPFNSSQPVLYYNKDMFKDAGIAEPPKTYDDVLADAKKLTKKGPDGKVAVYGIGLATYGWFFEQMLATQGADYVDHDNGRTGTATQAVFNGPEGLKIVNWWKSLYDAGVDLNLGPVTSQTQNAFLAGKCAMIIDSSGVYGNLVKGAKGKFEVGIGPLPRPAGATGGTIIGGGSLWITKDQPKAQQDAAWEFVKFAASPQEQVYWTETTGYFPITKAVYDDPGFKDWLKQYPDFQVAVDQLHSSKLTYATQGGLMGVFPQARQTVQDMLQAVLLGKQQPQPALDDAAKKVTDAIKNYNLTVG